MKSVYFIRHGESFVNLNREFSYKKVDKPLTPKGKLQAEQASHFFKNLKIDAIFSSPLLRAVETAQIIKKYHADSINLPFTVLEEFREINVGDLENEPPTPESWDIFLNVWREWTLGNYSAKFPKGENFYELSQRMTKALKLILKNPSWKTVIIVGHGGIFSQTLPIYLENLRYSEINDKLWPNTGITTTEMEIKKEQPIGILKEFAYIGHLSGQASNLISGVPDF